MWLEYKFIICHNISGEYIYYFGGFCGVLARQCWKWMLKGGLESIRLNNNVQGLCNSEIII